MKKMNNQQGVLTIEASIVLTTFMFFILFFYSFGRIYKAQSVVSHATIQCAQSLAVESYLRETISGTNTGKILEVINGLIGVTGGQTAMGNDYLSLGSGGVDLKGVMKKNFALAVAEEETEADAILKKYGIKDGLAGLNFSDSKIEDSDIIVKVTYTVKIQFPFMGKEEITLTKAAKSHSFKKID